MSSLADRRGGAPIPAKAGIGLRFQHHRDVLEKQPPASWLEIHPENYMGGGKPLAYLEAIRRDYPISLHGVGLSLGAVQGIDRRHLERLKQLADRIEPALVSDHLSWSAVKEVAFPDLFPLPMTEEALDVICGNIEQVQDRLGRRILVENPSTYLRYRHSTIPEWEFVSAVARRTGCGILCDVNNIFVSVCNHGFGGRRYLRGLPAESVGEIHLAGHSLREFEDGRSIRIDDHGSRVCSAVWQLYREAIALFGRVPTLIEWDTDIPALGVLLEEADRAEQIMMSEAGHARAA